MQPRVLKCPQCGAPLSVGKFQRQVVCAFCKSQVQIDPTLVHAARFREALAAWNAEGLGGEGARLQVGPARFRTIGLLAHGEVSDVYLAERDRWPSGRVLLKVVRDPGDHPLLAAEHAVLAQLQASTANGADRFTTLLPQALQLGTVSQGPFDGRLALALHWNTGFRQSLQGARRAYPQGVEPVISIWIWRRMLELLTFLHASGVVHGAVLPRHLMVQDGDHGLRLVGFSCAGAVGVPLRALVTDDERFYPQRLRGGGSLTFADDLRMSARSLAFALGAEGVDFALPSAVPAELAALVTEIADEHHTPPGAWDLHERVGALGRKLFGIPSFHPLQLP